MSENLIRLAEKASREPFFFGHALRLYAEGRGLDEAALGELLGIPLDRLPHLKLCRAPRPDPEGFRADTQRLAEGFGIDRMLLARIARDAAVTAELRQDANEPAATDWSLAARDREAERDEEGEP